MPRRNHRAVTYTPLDLTPAIEERPPTPRGHAPRYTREQIAERERERLDSQRQARMARGIDWSVCIVPGCGHSLIMWGRMDHEPGRRNTDLEIPICYEHAAVVWNQLVDYHTRKGHFLEAVADVNAGTAARRTAEREAKKASNLANISHGDIYFVRLGDLIKVGWTRDLWSRLKSYGASAELLLSYPATRDDETNLHRQLRPALAKGREWYHDGQIIQHFLNEALAKYGQPPTYEFLWTQPKQVVAGKRVMRTS
jgi:hypothetical protein